MKNGKGTVRRRINMTVFLNVRSYRQIRPNLDIWQEFFALPRKFSAAMSPSRSNPI